MLANRYKIRVPNIGTSATTISLPIFSDYDFSGKDEVIKKEFVDKETEKAINPIVDFEKMRFLPVNSNQLVENIIYKLNFLSGNKFIDIGFTEDDLKFRKNKFTKSFLRLLFYDSDITTNQNLLFFLTIFPFVTSNNIDTNGNIINFFSLPITFSLSDPIKNPNGFSEGYHLFFLKNSVSSITTKELFMRAQFNNAKTGKITNLITTNVPQSVDNLFNKLHTKYILKRINDAYAYEIDNVYSSNVQKNGIINTTINLFEISSI